MKPSNRDWEEEITHENGNYSYKCYFCKEDFIGHEGRDTICKQCYLEKTVPASEMFTTEKEMLKYIDSFMYKSKGVKGELRNRLVSCLNEFIKNEGLDTDQHNFIDLGAL